MSSVSCEQLLAIDEHVVESCLGGGEMQCVYSLYCGTSLLRTLLKYRKWNFFRSKQSGSLDPRTIRLQLNARSPPGLT